MGATAEIAVRVTIEGRVQGVWYRGWTEDQATEFGLRGWVRNRRDGSVEAVFAGPEEAVRLMIERCREGPHAARVTGIEQRPETEPVGPGFRQLPSA
jgi:acylphosphatase